MPCVVANRIRFGVLVGFISCKRAKSAAALMAGVEKPPLKKGMVSVPERQRTETDDFGRTVGNKAGMYHGGGGRGEGGGGWVA